MADLARAKRGGQDPAAVWDAPAAAGAAPENDGVCVHELVLANARTSPAAVALSARGSAVTYGALGRRALRLAARLRALGVGPDVPVGLCAERSPDLAVGALGILSAGGAYVAMDAAYPDERLAFILADSEAPVVVTRSRLAARLRGRSAGVVVLDGADDGPAPGVEATPRFRSVPGSIAYVVYTSGSTGTPKGVMVEHRGLLNLVRWHVEAFRVTPADRASQVASPGFDATVWELWPYLVAGASVHFADEDVRVDARALRDWLCREHIDIAFLPTPLAEAALDLQWPGTASLRTMLTGGDTLHRYPRPGLPFTLVNNYGPTENTVVATSGIVPPAPAPGGPGPAVVRPPSIGRPIRGCRVAIVGDDLQPVAPGAPGELLLGGAGLARGYLNQPELTGARFIHDPSHPDPHATLYRTGDLVRELPDGELEFLGRLDDQVQVRGYRVEPAEIEAALDAHPGVHASAVMAPEGANGERRLVAYVVPREGAGLDREELRRHVGRVLPSHMVPASFVFLSEMPLTTNGKLDRAALPAPGENATGVEKTAPRTELEREIVTRVAELLELARVGVDEDFFTLGGHSLMAAQLVAWIQVRYGVELALIRIFQARTASGLARAVDGAMLDLDGHAAAAAAALDVVAQPSGTRPTLFFVVSDESGLSALHHFIAALGEDQPVVGLVPPRQNRRFDRNLNVVHLAERQVDVIRERQPHGPYCLCGHSLGGLMAYETAGQLRSLGEEVAWVGLIDTMVPAASRAVLARQRRLTERVRRLRSRAAAVGLHGMLREMGERRAERLRASLGLPLAPDQFDFPGADTLTVTYPAVGHDAPVDVFATDPGRQRSGSATLGWETVHRGPLRSHPVAGDHHTALHDPGAPAVELFATRLFEAQRLWTERPSREEEHE